MSVPIRLIWQCTKCEDVVVSYSRRRHEMNHCKCGESAVDLEEHYQRSSGAIKEISRKKLINEIWVD